MKIDLTRLKTWKDTINQSLPGLFDQLAKANRNALIIGASCILIYDLQDWIPETKRQTGDLDIAVQLDAVDMQTYVDLKMSLLKINYRQDPDQSYRLRSPLITPGSFNYLDLLVVPSPKCSPVEARNVMGVGESFSFDGFQFAFETAYQIIHEVTLPIFGHGRASYRPPVGME